MKNSFIIALLLLIPYSANAYTMNDCIRCHTRAGQESVLIISMEEYLNSVHGKEIDCMDCHSDIENADHEQMKGSGTVDCGQCHEKENKHGLSAKEEARPQCYSCHGKHSILGKENKASTIHPKQLGKTCKICHPLESGEGGYLSWFPSLKVKSHKKQDFSQDYDISNCIGCHQGQAAHGEPGYLNDQNCYICHMNLKDRQAIMGYMHTKAAISSQPITFGAALIYQAFILFILWRVFRFISFKMSGKNRG